jgi:CopG family nickel-responsive transcriptional regulator
MEPPVDDQDNAHRVAQHKPHALCVATLSFLRHHGAGQVMSSLHGLVRGRQALRMAAAYMHVDDHHRVETIMLRGPAHQVQAFADAVMALPGVSDVSLHVMALQCGATGKLMQHPTPPLLM